MCARHYFACMRYFPTRVLSGRGPPPAGEVRRRTRSHSRAIPARAVTSRHDVTNEKTKRPEEKRRGRSADRRTFHWRHRDGCRSVLSGARSPLGAPPRLSVRRPNATPQLRAALHSSADRYLSPTLYAGLGPSPPPSLARHLADRSSCRPGRCPKPPGSGLQIRAQAPHPLRIQVSLPESALP